MIWVLFRDGQSGWFIKYERDGVCYVYRRVGDRTSQVCVEYKKIGDAFLWVEAD